MAAKRKEQVNRKETAEEFPELLRRMNSNKQKQMTIAHPKQLANDSMRQFFFSLLCCQIVRQGGREIELFHADGRQFRRNDLHPHL